MIRLEDILNPDRVMMELRGSDKNEILGAMVTHLSQLGLVTNAPEIQRLLVEREALMTTGVKRGFAFPHAFDDQFEQSFLTVGVIPNGVDYQSLDGNPVEFIFLLLGPHHHQTVHLRILARISRLMGQAEMLQTLRQATTPSQVMDVLADCERRLPSGGFNITNA